MKRWNLSWLAPVVAKSRSTFAAGIILVCWIWNSVAIAANSDEIEFFEKKIRPLLSDNCFTCHSHTSEKLKGGLYLDSREGLMKGGEDGPVINPAKPLESRL